MENMIAELYVCKNEDCQHVELELNDSCPECGGELVCTDFVPKPAIPVEFKLEGLTDRYICFWVRVPGYGEQKNGDDWHPIILLKNKEYILP
jgi:hypothetical protein